MVAILFAMRIQRGLKNSDENGSSVESYRAGQACVVGCSATR